jgi:predicted RNA-binding protein with PIN domain
VPQTTWFVDVMNVVGSRPDGWWRDREGAMADLVAKLEEFAHATGDDVIAVLDASRFKLAVTNIEIVFAPGGPNAADEQILRQLAEAQWSDPVVVTSDKSLAEQAEELGAGIVGAGEFRGRLEAP